ENPNGMGVDRMFRFICAILAFYYAASILALLFGNEPSKISAGFAFAISSVFFVASAMGTSDE
ncbi:hypothetical protein RSW84_30475, partial [Escherichia coli]|uniref:hypothetical protein n=1 Tax=Escherichia coli TaxID=562 RepID=UPI0028DD6FA5